MHTWLGRMPWALAWLFFTTNLLVFATSVLAAPPSADQLRGWVRQLDADDFVERENAGRNLATAGEAAIEALSEGIVSASPEVSWRATSTLEQIALSGNDATLARVAAALDRRSHQGKPGLALVVKELHVKRANVRRQKAVAKIRSLGGKFDGDDAAIAGRELNLGGVIPRIIVQPEEEAILGIELPHEVRGAAPLAALEVALKAVDALLNDRAPAVPLPDPPPDLPADEILPAADALLAPVGEGFIADAFAPPLFAVENATNEPGASLTIDRDWRGGDAGLKALGDLPNIRSLSLHRAPLTDAALAQIAALPHLRSLDIECTPLSAEALATLRQRKPQMRVFARGAAMLGVIADFAGPCVLTGVVAGSGAATAGVKAGDQIIAVGNQKVHDFSDLTIAVFAHRPGEKLRLEFNRSGESRIVDVLLKQRQP